MVFYKLLIIVLVLFVVGCTQNVVVTLDKPLQDQNTQNISKKTATFAGGCFWCMEAAYEDISGVIDVISGYTGGSKEDATYSKVSSGRTIHFEAVQVTYDENKISYNELLDLFWRQIDPTDAGGQFADRGPQYKTAIFYHDTVQKDLANKSLNSLAQSKKFDKPIATKIIKAVEFYKAEENHQDYSKKRTVQYQIYAKASGRKKFIAENWQEEKNASIKNLTKLQYYVTQKDGTEPPFTNKYWDNKKEGIYVDIVSGEVLFSSKDKYKSGTGWPSFTKPLEPDNIVKKEDKSLFGSPRIEIRSKKGNSHLGHVFDDGPKPTGKRYCMNSAALKFIPRADLKKAGYGKYDALFED